ACLAALAAFAGIWLLSSSTTRASAPADPESPRAMRIRAAGRGAPFASLRDGRDLPADYTGPAGARQALEKNEARPLALASGDFDEDGVADLVAGYAGGKGGLLTLHRGNADSINPESPEARLRRLD